MTRGHVVGLLMGLSVVNGVVENFTTSACLALVALIVLMEDYEDDLS